MAFGKYFKAIEEQTTSEDVTVVLDPQEEAVAAGADTAGDVLEVQERIAQLESSEDAVDVAVDDTETIEEQVANAEDSLPDGGLEQTAAAALDIAAEAFSRKMGIERHKSTGTGIEAFGGTSTRLRATKLAIEDIKSMAAAAWEKIVKFLTNIKNFIVNTISKLFDSYGALRERAVSVKNKAAKASGTQPSTVKKSGLAARVCINGVVNEAAVIKSLESASKPLFSDVVKGLSTLAKNFTDAASDEEAASQILSAVESIKTSAKVSTKLSAASYNVEKNNTLYAISETIPGDKILVMEVFNEKGDKPSFYLDTISVAGVKTPETDEVAPMSAKSIAQACDLISKIADSAKEVRDQGKQLMASGDTLINKIKNFRGAEGDANLRKAITNLGKSMSGLTVKYPAALLKASNAVLDWANNSIAGSGGGEDKKETKAK